MSRETDDKKPENKAAEAKHPLMEFVPVVFKSFKEWLERWEKTNYLAEKLGLLHSLLDGNSWWPEPELISLLLSIADGFTDESFDSDLAYPRFGGQRIEAKSREKIAAKAFSVLCLRFFKGSVGDEAPLWWWMLADDILFQKTLWFLRPRSGGLKRLRNCSGIRNNSSDHQQEIFRSFLKEFSRLGWEFRYPAFNRCRNKETEDSIKQRLSAARPRLIEILNELGELNWLNCRELDLDVESINKLTEMALEDSLFLPPEKVSDGFNSLRKPKSLEEAVLGGSIVAQILLLHQIKEKERERIRVLYEASERQREEQQRSAELDRIEQARKELDARAASLVEPSD